jgi:antitoxin HicB
VRCVDVPEAITAGASKAEALALAEDALLVALSGYVEGGRPLPQASKPTRGQPLITLPARVAFKFAIHLAMRQAGMTRTMLAARLGVDARQVRRILDIDHESTLDQLERALAALGLRAALVVTNIAA